ncbi:MAG: hypothetical protein RLY49_605 [Candidatus Parcubacteria bacterium]|jgi:DNA-3-methyladenine glycosylase I
MSYCTYIQSENKPERKALHKKYHDTQYGFPIHDDNELFARLVLEINQAGLSWETVLKKEESFRKAFKNFDIQKVSKFTQKDIERLLSDTGIIRNRLKVRAAVENAKTIIQIQKDFGSFEKWLSKHHPLSLQEWAKLFKKTFIFTGGEIVNEFLMGIGYLEGAHDETCSIHSKILKKKPMWLKK